MEVTWKQGPSKQIGQKLPGNAPNNFLKQTLLFIIEDNTSVYDHCLNDKVFHFMTRNNYIN